MTNMIIMDRTYALLRYTLAGDVLKLDPLQRMSSSAAPDLCAISAQAAWRAMSSGEGGSIFWSFGSV